MTDLITFKSDPIAFKKALAEAIEWLEGEGVGEHYSTVGTIFKIDPDSIRIAIRRKAKKTLNQNRTYNTHGGNNKCHGHATSSPDPECYEVTITCITSGQVGNQAT